MNFDMLPPRSQLVEVLTRIYNQGLTTTSGGNLSILDDNGDLWITPSGIDKGALSPEDIVCVRADGTIVGRHKPSVEYPFHWMIYRARPDLRALVHAHPPALVSFSIVRKTPNTCITPQSRDICGLVGYAPYALPGSEALGEQIAATFSQGFNSVLLENHGVVTGGQNLTQAFQRFETLEFCAQINLLAAKLGNLQTLTDDQIRLFYHSDHHLPEFVPERHSSRELELRHDICRFVRRAYARRLMISTGGTVSVRVQDDTFLITPFGVDRYYLNPEDIVLVQDGKREAGKLPSRAVKLHQQIYRDHRDIDCIMTAQPPNATTYSIVSRKFDTRTIPESYIVLRDIPIAPYGLTYTDPRAISAMIRPDAPVILLQNDAVLATGKSLLQTFDRLEVAEFSAQALINSLHLGELVPIADEELHDLRRQFKLS